MSSVLGLYGLGETNEAGEQLEDLCLEHELALASTMFKQYPRQLYTWTAKKTNEWVLNKAGVKRELLDTVKARKLAYYGHTMRKQGSCLEKEKMQGTIPGACRRGRPCTAWTDNIKTWTGLSVEESVRTTEDMDKWRKYVHGVANSGIEDG